MCFRLLVAQASACAKLRGKKIKTALAEACATSQIVSVRIREYSPNDFEALQRMHAAQGFGYPLPDLENPMFVSKLVLEVDDADESAHLWETAPARKTAGDQKLPGNREGKRSIAIPRSNVHRGEFLPARNLLVSRWPSSCGSPRRLICCTILQQERLDSAGSISSLCTMPPFMTPPRAAWTTRKHFSPRGSRVLSAGVSSAWGGRAIRGRVFQGEFNES